MNLCLFLYVSVTLRSEYSHLPLTSQLPDIFYVDTQRSPYLSDNRSHIGFGIYISSYDCYVPNSDGRNPTKLKAL